MFDTYVSGNDNKGLAKEEEIKAACRVVDYKKAILKGEYEKTNAPIGISVITDGQKAYTTVDDGFYLVVGATGSKKTRDVCMPYVYNNAIQGNSMFITDVKGDIYKNMSKLLRKLGYKIRVLNFNDPSKGDAYNPIKLIYEKYKNGNMDEVNKNLGRIAGHIFKTVKSEKDAFWHIVSENMFVGQMLCLMENFEEEQCTIENALELFHQGTRKMYGSVDYMTEFYRGRQDSPSWKLMVSGIEAPNDTKASIMAVYTTGMNKLIGQHPNLMKMLSHSTFEVEDVVREKTAVFIIANEETLAVNGGLITILIQQFYDKLIEISERTNGVLERKVSFLLDEFGNLPALPDFETKVSLSRARQIYFMTVVQSFAQLNFRYSADVAKIIIANTGNWIFLNSPDLEIMKYISELCGTKVSEYTGVESRVLSVSELRTLQKFSEDDGYTECLMLLNRMKAFITWLPDITEYYGIEPIEELDLETREDKEAEPLDFIERTKEVKHNRTKESLNKFAERREKRKAEEAEKEADKESDEGILIDLKDLIEQEDGDSFDGESFLDGIISEIWGDGTDE